MSQLNSPPPASLTAEPPKEKRTLLTFGRVLAYLAYAYVVVVEIVLGLGFVLQLFGASQEAGFVRWIYRSMERAMEPFRGIFPSVDLTSSTNGQHNAVLDTSVLFAMLVYAIVAWAIHLAIYWLTKQLNRYERERADALNRQTYLAGQQRAAAAYAQQYPNHYQPTQYQPQEPVEHPQGGQQPHYRDYPGGPA
ncbi:YGGT family protein [Branchiibius hedensis]|uniref:YGGT family protein n=1 Tax=Branchiibius hedensis TaxID=672460 RepID=A0A2Y9BUI1_9MICO|nr:YggT family protein [Branchiibius hedensis]PWJ26941.1 YGGT family protein [Branchiibius hedensis]SSA35752.1 YGGT family protein [Branchiibius hedensis]